MACCSDSGTGGSCCGSQQPFPWFSALRDPAMLRLFLRRYWRELLQGAASGCLAGLAALALADHLGALGPLLRGPWFHLHAGALLPATVLAGLVLALAPREGRRGLATASAWAFTLLALGGLANGLLEVADAASTGGLAAAFFQDGGYVSPVVFGVLGLPASWLARGCLAWLNRPRGCCP